ncbi:7699_t:CDS:2, partial [Dentiscutata erythropus]
NASCRIRIFAANSIIISEYESTLHNPKEKVIKSIELELNKTTQEELIMENQLFLNNSVESFLTKDFEHLFLNKNEEVTFNQHIELPRFLNKDTNSIYDFFKSWVSLFEKLG